MSSSIAGFIPAIVGGAVAVTGYGMIWFEKRRRLRASHPETMVYGPATGSTGLKDESIAPAVEIHRADINASVWTGNTAPFALPPNVVSMEILGKDPLIGPKKDVRRPLQFED